MTDIIINCKYLFQRRYKWPIGNRNSVGQRKREDVGKTQATGPRFETGTLGYKSKKHSREWCVWQILVMSRYKLHITWRETKTLIIGATVYCCN